MLAGTNPYFGVGVLKRFRKSNRKEWARFYYSLKHLQERGFVKFIKIGDEKIEIKITYKGKEILKKVNVDSMQIDKSKFDGTWRLIMFDVPNTKNKERLAFTEKLKDLGFIMIQKSVWALPCECYEEVMVLRKFYGIEKFVTYVEVANCEDQVNWKNKFLKNSPLFQ